MPLECQTVLIQIRADVLSGMTWVQTVCKDYQQTIKVATSGEIVKYTIDKASNIIMQWSNRQINSVCL